jgi:hypothetical protein
MDPRKMVITCSMIKMKRMRRKIKLISTQIFHIVIIIKVKLFRVPKIVLVYKALNNLMMTKMILMFSTLIKIILTITQLSLRK